jgi:hypothetical protein
MLGFLRWHWIYSGVMTWSTGSSCYCWITGVCTPCTSLDSLISWLAAVVGNMLTHCAVQNKLPKPWFVEVDGAKAHSTEYLKSSTINIKLFLDDLSWILKRKSIAGFVVCSYNSWISESTSTFKLVSLVIRDFHIPNKCITTWMTSVCCKYSVITFKVYLKECCYISWRMHLSCLKLQQLWISDLF